MARNVCPRLRSGKRGQGDCGTGILAAFPGSKTSAVPERSSVTGVLFSQCPSVIP